MKFENILLVPLFTEKSLALAKKGKYVFKVNRRTEKVEVKKRIEKDFDVVVSSIASLNMKGKIKMARNRKEFKKQGFKKYIVSLKSGKIGLFEKS